MKRIRTLSSLTLLLMSSKPLLGNHLFMTILKSETDNLWVGTWQRAGFYSEASGNYGKAFNEDIMAFRDSCFRMCRECLILSSDSHFYPPAPKKYTDESCPSFHWMLTGSSAGTWFFLEGCISYLHQK